MIAASAKRAAPGDAESRLALAQAMAALAAGDALEAEQQLRRHLLGQPRDAGAWAKLAEMAIGQRRMDEATIALRQAASAEPTAARLLAVVRHLLEVSGPAIALAEIAAVPPGLGEVVELAAFKATLLAMTGEHERALALLEQLTAAEPRRPALWVSLGNVLKTLGRSNEAVAALRRAIALRPGHGEAYWTLANFKSFRFTDRDLAAMHKALRSRPGDEDRLHLEFALGAAHAQRGDPARAFRHYAAGNALRAASFEPGEAAVSRMVDLSIASFSAELFERHAGEGSAAKDPIFVVGLHRSGSTLVEQILASHPLIEGASELPVMPQIWERMWRGAMRSGRGPLAFLNGGDRGALRAIGDEYLERTEPFRLTGRRLFVDKLPGNWLNLGLIRLALPNAKIVDARRHPMACGFSNFTQHYATGVAHAYSLESIGRFYADYLRLMDHFDAVQPGAVHHVVNERLIGDPDGEVRRLLAFVGVPYDPACLDFHRTKRAVNTPSAEQVRRPLNRDGVDSWRAYEPWLGPLRDALGPALEAWQPA